MLLFHSTLILECKDYIILMLQDELPIGLHIQHGERYIFFKFFHLQLVMSNNKKYEGMKMFLDICYGITSTTRIILRSQSEMMNSYTLKILKFGSLDVMNGLI